MYEPFLHNQRLMTWALSALEYVPNVYLLILTACINKAIANGRAKLKAGVVGVSSPYTYTSI
jgi:hypothetical protein